MRVFFREAFKLFLIFLRNSTFFIIENKMCTAYKDTFSLYTGRNPMSYNILHFRVHFLMFKSCFFCRRYYCLRHRVRKMLFQTGRYTKQFIFTCFTKWNNHFHGRHSFCKRACFVQYDRFRFCNRF